MSKTLVLPALRDDRTAKVRLSAFSELLLPILLFTSFRIIFVSREIRNIRTPRKKGLTVDKLAGETHKNSI